MSASDDAQAARSMASGATAEAPPAQSPAPAAAPKVSLGRVLLYLLAGICLALGAGLGQGFLTASLPQIAGDLGATTTEAAWLTVAYITPRCCLPLLLTKVRTQFGLRRFTETAIICFVLVNLLAFWTQDLQSALLVQLLSGCVAAAMSTLAFLYFMEPLSPPLKMVLGLPLALTFMTMASPLARVISPALLGDGGLTDLHLLTLGLSLLALALILRLPLTPAPREKVIEGADLVTFSLLSFGFAGVITCFVMGPIRWWTEVAWIGILLASSIAALIMVLILELRRKSPMLDVRWIFSPEMLHMSGTLLLFRILLSEQSAGAPRMFQVLGVDPFGLVSLFTVICLMTIVGGLACIAWMRPGRVAILHLVSLLLIAAATYMDSFSTIDTRPEQMILSQAMIAVAGVLFMAPAMMAGLLVALRKGMQYLMSFIIIYISTQSLGGMLGSGIFTTVINHRQAFHYQQLQEQLTMTNPAMLRDLTLRMGQMASQIADTATLRAQGIAQIATDATMQSYVLAYNDAYFLTCLAALAAAGFLVLHLLRDWMARRSQPMAQQAPLPQAKPQ